MLRRMLFSRSGGRRGYLLAMERGLEKKEVQGTLRVKTSQLALRSPGLGGRSGWRSRVVGLTCQTGIPLSHATSDFTLLNERVRPKANQYTTPVLPKRT